MQTYLYQHLASLHNLHADVVTAGYSLYHACCQHQSSSATARLFLKVLTGQLCEEVWWDQQRMLTGLQRVFVEVAAAAGALRSSCILLTGKHLGPACVGGSHCTA